MLYQGVVGCRACSPSPFSHYTMFSRSVDPSCVSALASHADGRAEFVANAVALCDSGLVLPSKLLARDLIKFCF